MNPPVVNHTRNETLVVISILCILLFIESGMRLVEKHLSGSVEHILSIPEIINQIDNNQADENIIFLGNSLTNNAIDTNIVENQLNNNSNFTLQTSKITPDATALSDWYCIYKNQIQSLSSPPEYLIIGFAWAQLSDQYPVNPARLGGFFCTLNDLKNLEETGLSHHQQALRFLAGATSHVYVNREAIRNRILDILIPDYQTITQNLNQVDNARQSDSTKNVSNYTYNVFERLIHSIQAKGTQVILVSMPVIGDYTLDKEIHTVAGKLNIKLLDMRKIETITPDMFKDSIHLNQHGQNLFSKAISQHISKLRHTGSAENKPL